MAKPVYLARRTDAQFVRALLPKRPRAAHKGDFGRALLLCGSEGLTGAARLAAKAALRTGCGLVYLGVPEKIYPIVAARAGSEIVFPLACDEMGRLCAKSRPEIAARLENMDAVLYGPGLGRSQELTELTKWLLRVCRVPLVLDADGINTVGSHIDVLRESACPLILTPHDGEFSRLGGDPKGKERVLEATRFARRTKTVLLLKGSGTIVTDGRAVFRNGTGNPGMAKGGSGDVLSGVIVSLLAQGVSPLDAAAAGAWLHGAAGDLAAARFGEVSMLPEDMIEALARLDISG